MSKKQVEEGLKRLEQAENEEERREIEAQLIQESDNSPKKTDPDPEEA